MQLLAETYDLMKRGLGLNDDELHDVYDDVESRANSMAIWWRSPATSSAKTGREDRQAADRRNPRRGQTERHRHVDLAKRDGAASADPDDRPRGRDAGFVRVREGARDGRRDLSSDPSAVSAATAKTFLDAIGPRALCRDDHHLRAGHGTVGGGVGQVRVSPRSRGRGADLAGRLHHSRGVAGGHLRGLSHQRGPAESAPGPEAVAAR